MSASSVNGKSYLALNLAWAASESRETPMMTALFFANLGLASRNCDASFVQPGVSALG